MVDLLASMIVSVIYPRRMSWVVAAAKPERVVGEGIVRGSGTSSRKKGASDARMSNMSYGGRVSCSADFGDCKCMHGDASVTDRTSNDSPTEPLNYPPRRRFVTVLRLAALDAMNKVCPEQRITGRTVVSGISIVH